jgi:hypothetical protein
MRVGNKSGARGKSKRNDSGRQSSVRATAKTISDCNCAEIKQSLLTAIRSALPDCDFQSFLRHLGDFHNRGDWPDHENVVYVGMERRLHVVARPQGAQITHRDLTAIPAFDPSPRDALQTKRNASDNAAIYSGSMRWIFLDRPAGFVTSLTAFGMTA